VLVSGICEATEVDDKAGLLGMAGE
jgi:hypothetical protein